MRAITRPILASFLTVLTASALAAAPARAVRGAEPDWSACADDASAQCAWLEVPVDWADPDGPTIRVAVARRPAADPGARIGTLIVNPGGPGGSGVDFALGGVTFFSPELLRRFDIVGFDPRGVSRSNPIVCSTALLAAGPPITVDDARQYREAVAYNRRLADDCAERTGPLYGHVDTLSVVRDLDALRAALGEEKISFYGTSYGTLLGEQYAGRYPHRIRALVLDSVVDHSVDVDGFLGGGAAAAEDSFDQFVRWCERSIECAAHGRDVRGLWSSLLAAARDGALWDPYVRTDRLTVYELVKIAVDSLYEPQWHALGRYLRDAEAGGDLGLGLLGRLDPVEVSEHNYPAVFCNDWAVPVTGYRKLRKHLKRAAARAPGMLFSPSTLSSVNGCLGWNRGTANPQAPLPPARTGPVLLVSARHDPATPYAWARSVADQLGPQASQLTYEGWGHVVYGRSGCVNAAVDRYLIELRPAPAGASCPGIEPKPAGIGAIALVQPLMFGNPM
ncbi:alpha/beta hydrolase [Actinoplanes sp. NPDC049668]|uniref:alpha/beta hydrolase n=1 Tax=unclassified Actinoplanes TaxID=2626549 RepID=UPI0033BB83A2